MPRRFDISESPKGINRGGLEYPNRIGVTLPAAIYGGFLAKFLLILRYCLVGASVATMYSTLVVLLVDGLNFTVPFLASATAFIVTVPLSFVAQKRFTFRNTDVDPRQFRRFVAMALTSFLLAVGSMHLVTHTLHLSYLWGILLTWILIPAVNLLINSLWVFGSDVR